MKRSECMVSVVTKGDRDISEVLKSLDGFGYVCVWNNSSPHHTDLKVYGRYAALSGQHLICQVYECLPYYRCCQDDDVIVDWNNLLEQYIPEQHEGKILCNMPQKWRPHYSTTGGISLVGFGAIMHERFVDDWGRARPFQRYDDAGWVRDEVFMRECDRVFTYLHRDKIEWLDIPMRQLDYSSAPDRMYRQARTNDDYNEIRRRLATL